MVHIGEDFSHFSGWGHSADSSLCRSFSILFEFICWFYATSVLFRTLCLWFHLEVFSSRSFNLSGFVLRFSICFKFTVVQVRDIDWILFFCEWWSVFTFWSAVLLAYVSVSVKYHVVFVTVVIGIIWDQILWFCCLSKSLGLLLLFRIFYVYTQILGLFYSSGKNIAGILIGTILNLYATLNSINI